VLEEDWESLVDAVVLQHGNRGVWKDLVPVLRQDIRVALHVTPAQIEEESETAQTIQSSLALFAAF
jgi:hypothetical protein